MSKKCQRSLALLVSTMAGPCHLRIKRTLCFRVLHEYIPVCQRQAAFYRPLKLLPGTMLVYNDCSYYYTPGHHVLPACLYMKQI